MFASSKAILVIIYFFINYSQIPTVRCDVHSVGTYIPADRVLQTTLFAKDSDTPTNYSLAFKYIHSMYRGLLTYLKVEINCVILTQLYGIFIYSLHSIYYFAIEKHRQPVSQRTSWAARSRYHRRNY